MITTIIKTVSWGGAALLAWVLFPHASLFFFLVLGVVLGVVTAAIEEAISGK